ncbi:hypothetical protein ACOMHN_067034 [Nucella lapillus]
MKGVLLVLFLCFSGGQPLSKLDTLKDYVNHPCVRTCKDGQPPRRCEYDWTLELYWTLSKACFDCPFQATHCSRPHCVSADGTSRGLVVINRMVPGPGVQVCEGDEVIVNVYNAMETSAGTTIHWHGHRQRGSQVMDGVNLITQCPITQMNTFQYRFKADDPGTHWWHSHAGLQRSDGVFGSFVTRQPPSRDPHSALYDLDLPEHVITVIDWLNEMTESRFSSHHHDDGDNKPASMLINGKGAFAPFRHPVTNATVYTPYAEFKVKAGTRYRFRVISAAIMNCPIQFSIDGHTLIVIASDGSSFDPIVVDSFNIFAGERYDFVLNARDNTSAAKDPRNFWIRVRGLADCGVKKAHQVAVLRYEGVSPDILPGEDTGYDASVRKGLTLNPWNEKATNMLIPVEYLNSTDPDALSNDDDTLKEIPDKKFFVAMEFNKVDNFHYDMPGLYPLSDLPPGKQLYSPQLNHISFLIPSVPLLTQFDEVDEEKQFCNAQTVQVHCETEYCECTHRLKVALGDVVEIIIVDEGVTFNANHPMHMHGYKYRVIGMDKVTLYPEKLSPRRGQL